MKPWFAEVELFGPSFEEARVSTKSQRTRDFPLSDVGGWIRSERRTRKIDEEPRVLTPLHGRSATRRLPDCSFVQIKGCGWTWGPMRFWRSPKEEMTFGLFPESAARREVDVSSLIDTIFPAGAFTSVLGYAVIEAEEINLRTHATPTQTAYNNAEDQPALLYTKCLSPIRVADLAFYSGAERRNAVVQACRVRSWIEAFYFREFSDRLASTISALHDAGAVNDTLEPSNVTMAAEVTDFEWLFLPPFDTPDASGSHCLSARQAKEVVYGLEVITHLCSFLLCDHLPWQLHFLREYIDRRQTLVCFEIMELLKGAVGGVAHPTLLPDGTEPL